MNRSHKHLVLAALFFFSPFLTSARSFAALDPATQETAPHPRAVLADLFLKQPYLVYPGDPTRMQVLWQLSATESATIQWGTDLNYSTGRAETSEYGTDHQHSFTLTGLTPGQHYFYRVTVSGVSHTGSFNAAPPPSTTRLKFMAYGDTRSNPSAHDQVAARMIATWEDDPAYQTFALMVGDFVSSGDDEQKWTDEFFDPSYTHIRQLQAQIAYQACMGNHEGSGALFVKYFPYPFTGGRYWSFDYGPVHVVIVDQYTSYKPGSAQLQWIEADLAASHKPWKFLCLHEPGWSAGGGHSNDSDVQNYLQPLCVQYGVSIVFGGHNHYYARAVVDGVQHITTGGGGAPLYDPDLGASNIVAAASAFHFCAIDIDGRTLRLRALGTDGAVIDSVRVVSPTPVTLSDITAVAGSDYVDLHWSAFLDGPATLQVLRSARNDGDYAPVSEPLNGSRGRQEFTWRDATVQAATHYFYMIRWRETADWFYSAPLRVMTATAAFGITGIAPSPVGSGASRIDFELAQSGHARLDIFDAAGKHVCTLVDADFGPGARAITWDGRARDGRPLPAGVYFATLSSNGAAASRKFVLAR